jgi:hypothetical protein
MERRRGGAVRQTERVAGGPDARGHLAFDDAVRRLDQLLGSSDAVRIVLPSGTQSVADDLLHRLVQVHVVEAILKACFERVLGIRGQERHRARMVLREILDDHA